MSSDRAALIVYVDSEQLKADLEINSTDIDEAMRKHAGLYAHYATQAVRARAQHERWKSAFEVLEAQLDAKYRRELAPDGDDPKAKKPTEPQIRAAVVSDSAWKACSSKVIEAQQIQKLAEIGERSFEQRKDMLLQVARNQAREAEGQLRLVQGQAAGERQQALKDRVKDSLGALKDVS